ncbi:hypothetical protein P0F65_10025 [Sphingomonas sp. I4]
MARLPRLPPLPWLWKRPDAATLIASALAVAVFLPLYVLAHRWQGGKLFGACAAITAIGIALAAWPVGWTVFPIYAASAMGHARPRRVATIGIAAIAVATTVTGLVLSQPTLWWLPGVLLVVMTGGGTISREAFTSAPRRCSRPRKRSAASLARPNANGSHAICTTSLAAR